MKRIIFFIIFLILVNANVSNSQIIQLRDTLTGLSKIYYSNYPFEQPKQFEKLNYDSLPVIKNPTLVNLHSGDYGAEQTGLSIAMDSSGNYLCVWIDNRDGYMNIYAQLYDKFDRKVGNNFIINKDKIWGNIVPIVSANKKGDFIIIWENDLREIYARRISNTGQFLSEPIRLNLNNQINTFPISAAIAENGSFIAVWRAEEYYGDHHLYAVVVDPDDNVSGEIIIDEPYSPNTSAISARRVAVTGDHFLVVFPSIAGRMFAQKVSMYGAKIGNNFLINEINYSSSSYDVKISSLPSGNSLILWKTDKLFGRIYNPQSGFLTGEFVISDTVEGFSVFTDRDSIFYLLYSVNYVDYFQKISKDGQIISERTRADYDSLLTRYYFFSDISDLGNNSFIIGNVSYARSDLDCFIQKFSSEFQRLTSIRKINDDLYSSWQIFPKVKFNSQGKALIIWEDRRNGRRDLYGRLINENLEPVGDDFQINETTAEYFFTNDKAVCSFSDGTFVVAFWMEGPTNYKKKLILQLISKDGQKIGNNKAVAESYNYDYSIAMNINLRDELLLCWYNYFHTLTQLFDKNLNPITNVQTLLSARDNIGFNPLKISIDENHFLLAVWRDYSIYDGYSYPSLKGRFFNYRPVSDVFIIDSAASEVYKIECANDSNNSLIVIYGNYNQLKIKRYYDFPSQNIFSDRFYTFDAENIKIINFKNKKALYVFRKPYEGQIQIVFYNDNKSLSNIYSSHQFDENDYYLYYFADQPVLDADISDNKFLISYSQPIPERGTDIFIKAFDGSKFNFNRETTYFKTKTDFLYNNFPNPFNNKTVIPYQILSFSKVKLSVYDILGNLVKVLVDEYQYPGIYEVEFNAGELSSGIYFYKLEAFNTITKKMMILK